jgi:DNA recombination protein RmuC
VGEAVNTWFAFVAGLAAGAAVGTIATALLLWRRLIALRERADAAARESAALAARIEERAGRLAQVECEIRERERAIGELRDNLASMRETHARALADLENERQNAAEKAALLDHAEARLREAFQSLSAEALAATSRSFLDLAKAALGEFTTEARKDLEASQKDLQGLVTPVRDSLQQVDAKLQAVEKERLGAYAALSEQVRSMATTQQQLQAETSNLAKALRVSTVRGRWGEIQLRRVVELAGMLEHCDFEEQAVADRDSGRLRPDLVIHLPAGRNIVVDAKAPLQAYLEAVEASDEASQEARLKDHARQVRDHVTRLGAKAYWSQFQPTPEFVVLFLPGEAFFSAALRHDPGLIEFGVERRVIPATPTTLIALLRAVHYGWQQDALAANAEAIRDLGVELYSRLRAMAEHFEDMRRGLDRAVDAYNRMAGSFERRVLVQARRFRDLGAGNQAEIASAESIDRPARPVHADDEEGDAEREGGPEN